MTQDPAPPQAIPANRPPVARRMVFKLEFNDDQSFEDDLRQRVNAYFAEVPGRLPTGDWRMFLQTAIVLAFFVTAYVLLVFVARTVWQGVLLASLLGLASAGIGFNIGHDGGHRSYSKRAWVNRLAAMSFDLAGASSYVWFWKHAVIHHRYVNITGYDTDINLGIFGRVSPHKQWQPQFRWQHLYLWPLYGVLAIKWQLLDDFQNIAIGRIGPHVFPRPRGWDLAIFVGGKVFFFAWAFALPLVFHPWYAVLFYYAVGAALLGLAMSVVFQLPHCSGRATFPLPDPATGRMADSWAVHQARVTLDFGRGNRILSWPLGGLNYHLEHHLFPLVCHVHYPAITRIVEQTCRDHGVPYAEHPGFLSGLAEHYRWLRRMGQPDAGE